MVQHLIVKINQAGWISSSFCQILYLESDKITDITMKF